MDLKKFKNKKIIIMGLGLHGGGVGAARFFAKAGAKVLVTDLRKKEDLKESLEKLKKYKNIKYVLGQHRLDNFINADLIIKNPAVKENSRYLEAAKKNKVKIDTDIGIFFANCKRPIVGITGSKGKSTVASLITKFLEKKYPEVILAGNIRNSVLNKLAKLDKKSIVVLELSSWQLAGLKTHQKSPQTAVITNILPDHLNRYKDMEAYIQDKKLIFRWQKSRHNLILNYDDMTVRSFSDQAKAKVFYFSQNNGVVLGGKAGLGAFLKGDKILYQDVKQEICALNDIELKGRHNIDNVLAAVSVAKLYEVTDKQIKKVLSEFKGISGRMETIDIINGVKYINDTAATIPESTLAAINSFPLTKPIILIAGGTDKNLDFNHLAEVALKRLKCLILLEGSATIKLKKALKAKKEENSHELEIIGPFDNMKEAVKNAYGKAEEGDIILLSPACASFGLFRHEFERGEAFVKAIKELE